MSESINDKVMRWGKDANAPVNFLTIWEQIVYLAEKRFSEYHPTVGPHPDFRARLRSWINCAPLELDQQLLFQLVSIIFFVGSQEFQSLYRVAYNGPITRWLIDDINISLSEVVNDEQLQTAIKETWFCPITDSMEIASFHHVNNIEGKNYRPDWRSLWKFGAPDRIIKYMRTEQLRRVVLIEDFVGSGSQIEKPMEFAAKSLPLPFKILVVPLIVCPNGNKLGHQFASHYENLEFKPILLMGERAFVRRDSSTKDEPNLYVELRDLTKRLYHLVTGGDLDSSKKPYGPFGFDNTGSLLVMYTNCPDNTLPIIHHPSKSWKPLFPRSSRI